VIVLCCAVEKELSFWQPREDVETLITGVGPVEAAAAVAAAIGARRYTLVVSAGLGGAFDGAAQIGDGVVVADDRMEIDLENGEPIRLPQGAHTVERASSDAALVAAMQERGFAALRGITVSRVTSSEATAQRLAVAGAQIESMEGFAVLRASERAGITAIEVRGISNRCGARESSRWSFETGIMGLRHVVTALFECYGQEYSR